MKGILQSSSRIVETWRAWFSKNDEDAARISIGTIEMRVDTRWHALEETSAKRWISLEIDPSVELSKGGLARIFRLRMNVAASAGYGTTKVQT